MKNDKEYKKQIELYKKAERQTTLIIFTIFILGCSSLAIFLMYNLVKTIQSMILQDGLVILAIVVTSVLFFIIVVNSCSECNKKIRKIDLDGVVMIVAEKIFADIEKITEKNLIYTEPDNYTEFADIEGFVIDLNEIKKKYLGEKK